MAEQDERLYFNGVVSTGSEGFWKAIRARYPELDLSLVPLEADELLIEAANKALRMALSAKSLN